MTLLLPISVPILRLVMHHSGSRFTVTYQRLMRSARRPLSRLGRCLGRPRRNSDWEYAVTIDGDITLSPRMADQHAAYAVISQHRLAS